MPKNAAEKSSAKAVTTAHGSEASVNATSLRTIGSNSIAQTLPDEGHPCLIPLPTENVAIATTPLKTIVAEKSKYNACSADMTQDGAPPCLRTNQSQSKSVEGKAALMSSNVTAAQEAGAVHHPNGLKDLLQHLTPNDESALLGMYCNLCDLLKSVVQGSSYDVVSNVA